MGNRKNNITYLNFKVVNYNCRPLKKMLHIYLQQHLTEGLGILHHASNIVYANILVCEVNYIMLRNNLF